MIFDESIYPVSWRLNSPDCGLSPAEKAKIILLNHTQSSQLWDSQFSFGHLMEINSSSISVIEKEQFDFDAVGNSANFFSKQLIDVSIVFFFWARRTGAIVPVDVFIKAWDDFFYPSDESSILCIPNSNKVIYSYEEMFFYAENRFYPDKAF